VFGLENQTGPQASVIVANSVAMEVGSNNVVIIGAFDGLQSPMFPTRTSFFAMAKVWGMPAKENNSCVLKLVDVETNAMVAEAGAHNFASAGPHDVHTAISYFQNVTLPKSGIYEVRAISGDQVIGRYPLAAGSAKA
jgi:hypothetical protein